MELEAKKILERDWTSLPHDVLNYIAKKLSEISDFVRFRAVCTAWSSSTPITDLPPQFPWIIECFKVKHADEEDLRFYSIASNKQYTVHPPKYVENNISGRKEGSLALAWISSFSLMNPLNNHEIPLPTFDFNCYALWFMHRKNLKGVSTVCCGAMGSQSQFTLLSCQFGQDKWHVLQLESNTQNLRYFYLNDMLFTVECGTGVTKVTNITTGALSYVIPPVDGDVTLGLVYLVEASGDILWVFRHYEELDVFTYSYWFDVHRLDLSKDDQPGWVKVNNIGSHAVFIDMEEGFALEANDMAGIRANCIYCIEEGDINQVKRIDVETGASQFLPFPSLSPTFWFVPNLCHI